MMTKAKALEAEIGTIAEDLTDKKPEEFIEHGIRPEDGCFYVAVRSFLLPVRLGPPVDVPKGANVLLSRVTADELFYSGRIEPVTVAKFFRVTENFISIEHGAYVVLEKGDTLELERDEGIQLLRERKVQQIDETEVEK